MHFDFQKIPILCRIEFLHFIAVIGDKSGRYIIFARFDIFKPENPVKICIDLDSSMNLEP